MNHKNKYIIEFKQFLDHIQYDYIMTKLIGDSTHYTNPFPEYNMVKIESQKVDRDLSEIICFLSIGDRIKRELLESNLSCQLIQYLLEEEIIDYNSTHYWLNNYLVVAYSNSYFLVSNVYYYPTCKNRLPSPYMGVDTFWLSHLIVNRVKGDVLDVCTGSGIQAIIAAKTASSVDAVDIDTHALEIAKFNAILNCVDQQINFYISDVFESLPNRKYDFIISNPPFIPIPNEIDFPLAGDGGPDGREIIKRILSGCSLRLKNNGELIMIGQVLADEKKALIEDDINDFLTGLSTHICYSNKTLLETQATNFATLSGLMYNKQISPDLWMDYYKKIGVNYLLTFYLNSKKRASLETIVNRVFVDDSWSKYMVPSLKNYKKNAHGITYVLQTEERNSILVDDETITFLNLCDGELSLIEIIEKMPLKYRLKYGNEYKYIMLNKYLTLCAKYERVGILSKRLDEIQSLGRRRQ